jgi:transcriptional regulator with XRE-family HTH domain
MARKVARFRRPGREIDLADQLRDAIGLSGRSASEVARLAEVDPAQVLRFLSGERDVRLETAGRICRALGWHLAEVARGRGRPSTAPARSKSERLGFEAEGRETGVGDGESAAKVSASDPLDFLTPRINFDPADHPGRSTP